MNRDITYYLNTPCPLAPQCARSVTHYEDMDDYSTFAANGRLPRRVGE